MDELYKNENSSYGLVEDNRAVVNLYIRAYRLESLGKCTIHYILLKI